jgi:hypothetical protein
MYKCLLHFEGLKLFFITREKTEELKDVEPIVYKVMVWRKVNDYQH